MWIVVHVGIHSIQVDKNKMANVQIHHHLQVTLATCYEKSVLNEEKKSYETALAEASKASKASESASSEPCSQPVHNGVTCTLEATILDRAKSAYPGWRALGSDIPSFEHRKFQHGMFSASRQFSTFYVKH